MRIAVCIKSILDPEIAPRDFKIDPGKREPVRGNASTVLSPFDENALELALQLRDRGADAHVVAFSLGGPEAVEGLRRALAMKADEAVHVDMGAYRRLDSFVTARLLAKAIVQTGGADLVLCGRQAGDWDQGQVGAILAENLAYPCVTFAARIEGDGDRVRLRREGAEGTEIVTAAMPLVVTVTNDETNQPRIPKVPDVIASHRKLIITYSPADLGVSPDELDPETGRLRLVDLTLPVASGSCEMVAGDDAQAKAANLARRLLDLKVL